MKGNLEYDEGKLIEGLKKTVMAQDSGNPERALHLSQALSAFQRSPVFQRKWAIFQFLLRVTERFSTSSVRFSKAPRTIPASRGAFELPRMEVDDDPMAAANVPGPDAWQLYQKSREGMLSRERLLLKDLVACFQGLEGHYIQWDQESNSYRIPADVVMESQIRGLAESLASVGALVRELQQTEQTIRPESGLLAQGLKSGLQKELEDWSRTVALFESLVAEGPGVMTLRRATVWLHSPRRQLTLLHDVTSPARRLAGVELLDSVAGLKGHGCKNVCKTVERLLESMTQPYLAALSDWVFRGCLVDPYNELFITKTSDAFWSRAYSLEPTKIPRSLMSMEMAEKLLVTGKTVHFLNLCEAEHGPEQDEPMETDESEEQPKALASLSDTTALTQFHSKCCQRLGALLLNRHGLVRHLAVLRDYLLLGRGDFCQSLLESLAEHLERPANNLYRHHLVAGLDSAVRATASSPEAAAIVCSLDVRLHDPTPGSRQLGWDIFSLDYRVPSPLDAVLGPETMREYSRLAQFLWLERRVHFTAQASATRLAELRKPLRGAPHDLLADWKRLQYLQQEALMAMSSAIQYSGSCCMTAWSRLSAKLEVHPAADLDAYAHLISEYLADIKSNLLPAYSQSLRPRTMALLFTILKIERVGQMLIAYLNALFSNPAAASEAPMLKALTDIRTAIHSAARQFQLDMDEFMTGIQRETVVDTCTPAIKSAAMALNLLYDFNGYHERRGGFDQGKYALKSL